MSLGQNIRTNREMKGITQTDLAKSLGVSYQAVSGWEKDTFAPNTHNLIKLASALDVSLSVLVEDRIEPFKVKDHIYNWEHMKTYVKTTARDNDMTNTLSALNYAVKAHKGQKRKNTNIPYIYHLLTPIGIDYIVMMVTHPLDDDLNALYVGQTFSRGEPMFREGNDGNATGYHFHISIGLGNITGNGWAQNSNGVWVLTTTGNTIKVNEAFYVDSSFTTILNANGYTFMPV